jgi:hypothetical protein
LRRTPAARRAAGHAAEDVKDVEDVEGTGGHPDDGDILFTASTGEVPGETINSTAVGVVVSELAWDAVLASFDPNT